jgi:hypothetical protein
MNGQNMQLFGGVWHERVAVELQWLCTYASTQPQVAERTWYPGLLVLFAGLEITSARIGFRRQGFCLLRIV